MKTRYHIIKSYSELEKLVEACLKTGYASVDFETNAEPIYNDTFKPTILSVTFQPGSGISIPLQHFECSESHINKTWLEWLTYFGRNVIENPNVVKIAWNWKFDNQIFQRYNIYSRGTVIDGMLAKYLLNEERPNGLKDMVRRFLPEFSDYEKYDSFDSIPWSKKPLKKLCEYGCMDTDFTFRLSIFFESFLIKKGFYNLYRNLIMPASKVLQSAEKNGLPFDVELNVKLREKYNNLINEYNTKLRSIRTVQRYQNYIIKKRKEDYIETLESEIEELREEGKDRQVKTREQKLSRIIAGEYTTKAELKLIEEVNFSSQKQMVDLLYNSNHGFKFPVIAYTVDKHKKPTNNPSTAEDTLIKLKEHDKSGFIDTLLDLRGVQTINSTFIVGLGDLVQSDGGVHPTFLIHGCVSGNTKLIGKENDIRIEDICPKEVGVLNVEDKNIWVLSHEGTWEQVTHTINKGKQPLYKITTKNGDILRCTKEHKLLTPKGWKRVSYIFKHNLNVVMYDTSKLDITKPIVGKKYDEIIFRDIPGWDGYIASSEGKIYSVKIPGGRGMLDYNHPHELVPREWKPGRLRVYLRNNSKKKYSFSVSHLVWMAFNNKLHIPEKMVIDHINCNTLDNRPENLQCITYSENIKRAYTCTRTAFTSNGINGTNKFNTLTISKVLEDYQNGYTQAEICERYNISQKQVSGIVNGQRRKDIYLTKLVSMEYEGEKTIYDLSVNDKHSYITRSNFINSNTVSGRLSSRNPNGQNIPKTMVNPDVKLQFIPPKNQLFLSYDYSQAELRILAHLANESTMLEWFRTGKDIHLASACKKYHEDYDEIIKIYQDEQHPEYKLWKKRRKQAKCYSPDTEILTPTGWQRLDSYDGVSLVAQYDFITEEISFVKPENYGKVISKNNYIYSDRNISLDITDEHKTLFITRSGKKVKDDFKNLVGKSGYMPVSGNFINHYSISDDLTRFIAMFISDGNYNGSGKIRFGFTKERKITRCKYILEKIGAKYTNPKKGKFYIPFKGNEFIYEVLKEVSNNKTLKWCIINKCNGSIYLQEAANWDGHINRFNHVTFYTIIKDTAEIMQVMGHLNNYMVTLRCNNNRYILGYSLNKKNKARVNLKNAIPYNSIDGKEMWSVTVPSRNLVIRKDNKIVLSGNTINFGIVYEQSAAKLAESLSTPEEPVSKEEGQQFLDDYFKTFPKVKKFMEKQHKFMEKHGYCVSLFGRRRRCPKVYSENYGEYLEALRQSTNMPCQSAASDMALFASVIVYGKVKKGELPPMKEVNTVHDSVYQFILPKYITPDTIYNIWDICRNPSTKEYFGFSIDDVDMSMDFTIGRNMAEELPYIPGYDYNKLLREDFDIDEYYREYNKFRDIPISDYPKKFKKYFKESWRKR
jgi:DNA polymerase I-like protein with 3'-5' exonuclease and polymerase domains